MLFATDPKLKMFVEHGIGTMSRLNPSMYWEIRLNSDQDWSLGWIPTVPQTSPHEPLNLRVVIQKTLEDG